MAGKSNRAKVKCVRTTLLVMLTFFFLLSSFNQAAAAAATQNYATATATIQKPQVSIILGNSGTSSITSTNDYANVAITAGLTFYERANLASIIPTVPSIDGSVKASFSNAKKGTCTLNTASSGDLIYVAIQILGANAVSTVNNTGAALTWTQRAAVVNGASVRIETWWAYSSTVFSGKSINVYFDSPTTFAIVAFGVKNVNPQTCFDNSASALASGTGKSRTQTVSLSTSLNNVLLIGSIATRASSGSSPNPTSGTGYSKIQSSHLSSLGYAVESRALSTAVSSYAVTFSTGITTVSWAMIGDAIWGTLTTPSVNTDFDSPKTSGSANLADGAEGYLVSPAYPRETTIYAGTWQLNLWISAWSTDELEVYLLVTDSSYNILASVAGKVYSETVSTSKSLVTSTFSGAQVTIPSGGHLVICLLNAAGGTSRFTVYWGNGQTTNFETPQVYDYILKVVNLATTAYNIAFSALSNTTTDRLVNFTMYVYSPTATCIVITNGDITQGTSGPLHLPSTGTLYVAINATASDFNDISTLILQMQFSSNLKPFTCDIVSLLAN